jgi:hypothetical protein
MTQIGDWDDYQDQIRMQTMLAEALEMVLNNQPMYREWAEWVLARYRVHTKRGSCDSCGEESALVPVGEQTWCHNCRMKDAA